MLAYPGGLTTGFAALDQGEPHGIELAVEFLESDPWFFRSGYIKADLIRKLKRQVLSESMKCRLREVMLEVVDGRDRREFRDFCALARKIASPDLVDKLNTRLASENRRIKRHARWVLDALHQP